MINKDKEFEYPEYIGRGCKWTPQRKIDGIDDYLEIPQIPKKPESLFDILSRDDE